MDKSKFGKASVIHSLLLGFAVFLLCLFGIFTRPNSDLASFWPANAFMLGMVIRFPHLATPLSWIACSIGFFLADFVTGGTVVKTLVLNLGNLTAITAGYLCYSQFDRPHHRLVSPNSILLMLVAITAAAVTAGLIGTIADPILFGGSPLDALFFWSATEFVNYIAFLPMLLLFPDKPLHGLVKFLRSRPSVIKLLPLIALIVTAIAAVVVGGPGAIAFPILALLWCALTYSLFATSCLAFVFVFWTLMAIAMGYLPVAENFTDRTTLLSIRVAVSLTGIAPLMIASIMAAREELVQRLLFLSSHDQMTGIYNRSAFFKEAEEKLQGNRAQDRMIAVLMLDIDHFKNINDKYGHAAGDCVIVKFSQLMKQNLRKGDIVGRLGGEEFSALLDGCTEKEATEIAERVNRVFSDATIHLKDGRAVKATVSIGMIMTNSSSSIDTLLSLADEALYEAKNHGRNMVRARVYVPE